MPLSTTYGLDSLVAELQGDAPAEGADARVEPGTDGQLVLRSEAPLRRVATVDIRVPMEFKRRGGRKEIVSVRSPEGLPPDARTTPDVGPRGPIVVALARAYKWQKMLDTGEVGSMDELAERYGVDRSYIGRILKLAGLAPDIVEEILAGDEPNGFSLERLKGSFPLQWDEQREHLGFPAR